MKVEYSPVTDFREARCRQYDEGTCGRGHYCNFMHVKEPAKELRKHLEKVFHVQETSTNFSLQAFSILFLNLQEYGFTGGRMKGIAGMNTMKMTTGGGGGVKDSTITCISKLIDLNYLLYLNPIYRRRWP